MANYDDTGFVNVGTGEDDTVATIAVTTPYVLMRYFILA